MGKTLARSRSLKILTARQWKSAISPAEKCREECQLIYCLCPAHDNFSSCCERDRENIFSRLNPNLGRVAKKKVAPLTFENDANVSSNYLRR